MSMRLFLALLLLWIPLSSLEEGAQNQNLSYLDRHVESILDKVPALAGTFLQVVPFDESGPSFINSVYLVKTTSSKDLVLKIGNLNWESRKTINEVSALNYLYKYSTLPVPEVLAFVNDRSQSEIACEYILMPRVPGAPLSQKIHTLYQDRNTYLSILDQLAAILAELRRHKFSCIGNFLPFTNEDLELKIGGLVDFAGYAPSSSCLAPSDFAKQAIGYYIDEMKRLVEAGSPDQELFSYYIPLLKETLKLPWIATLDQRKEEYVFSHQDFVMKNILVEGSRISAILDWEWSGSTLKEIEGLSGCDFLFTEEDQSYFSKKLEEKGVTDFFTPPPPERQLFYRLLGNIYTLVAFREWQQGKLEHTAKFLSIKKLQRKIRSTPDFDWEQFKLEVAQDLDCCLNLLRT